MFQKSNEDQSLLGQKMSAWVQFIKGWCIVKRKFVSLEAKDVATHRRIISEEISVFRIPIFRYSYEDLDTVYKELELP